MGKTKAAKMTIHVVAHAHLDPVWMWPKPQGVDEALACCRAARDRLLEFPDATYIQGEAWVYEQIERLDPELFKSIRKLVEEGRWEVVGGWYLQPDCNFLTVESFRKQMEMGQAYFKHRFGRAPRVGFNPDAFGHAASLPDLMSEYGFKYYVHMRPDGWVMPMPSPLYRWRGVGGGELLGFRVVGSYSAQIPQAFDMQVEAIRKTMPQGIGHGLAFLGSGDHGGGATADLIEHVLSKRHAWEDTEVVFGTFEKFFQAVEPKRAQLPVKEGEHHFFAIGCYSVNREIKTSMRAAEHALARSETALNHFGRHLSAEETKCVRGQLEAHWKTVLFNQFHDILPGSLIRTGKEDSVRELGGVIAYCQDLTTLLTRRIGLAQPPHEEQRLFVANLSDTAFDGIVEHEPWVLYEGFRDFELYDESGNLLPYQRTDPEPYSSWYFRMLIPLRCEAGQVRSLVLKRTNRRPPKEVVAEGLKVSPMSMETPFWKVDVHRTGVAQISRKGAGEKPKPLLGGRGCVVEMADDDRDTWGMMGPGHFLDEPVGVFNGEAAWTIEERGPMRMTLCQTLRTGDSTLAWRVRLYATAPRIEFDLKLHCREKQKRFTLRLPFANKVVRHTDGIPGAQLQRALSPLEYPFQDWTLIETADAETSLSVLSPDAFSFSVREDGMHFTLLRAKPYAWVGTDPERAARTGDMDYTDQGEFRFRFVLMPAQSTDGLARLGRNLQQPPVSWDLTKGMKRYTKYLFGPPREGDELE